MKRYLFLSFLVLASSAVSGKELSPQRIKKIAEGAYAPCLKGAAASAPQFSEAVRAAYCQCYSQRFAELTTEEDIDYFARYKTPSDHGRRMVEISINECAAKYVN